MKRRGRTTGTTKTTKSVGRTTKAFGDGAWAGLFASRNITDYDRAGEISERDADEILAEARAFGAESLAWLKKDQRALIPKGVR